jgi:hypothetical protein
MLRLAMLVFLAHAGAALAEGRRDSACLAMSEGEAQVIPAAFGAPLEAETVRIRFLGHASFALETAGGTLAVTDYTGYIGNPDVVPNAVTMNIAHDTHFTDTPDPRISLVLRGWGDIGQPAQIDEELGDLRVRNVTSDLRGPFGEGGRKDGNSIFIFEAAGLCIGHLGHLHQVLSDAQHAAIGIDDGHHGLHAFQGELAVKGAGARQGVDGSDAHWRLGLRPGSCGAHGQCGAKQVLDPVSFAGCHGSVSYRVEVSAKHG